VGFAQLLQEIFAAWLARQRGVGGHARPWLEPIEQVGDHGGVDKRMLTLCAPPTRLGADCFFRGVAYTEHGIIVGKLLIHAEF